MRLTERQQNMVSVFLERSGETVRGLSVEAQSHAIAQVKTRLKNDLNGMGDRILLDEEVEAILERCRVTPTGWQHPPHRRPSQAPQGVGISSSRELVAGEAQPKIESQTPRLAKQPDGWLGVCRSLSKRFGYELRIVRGSFVILGMLTGPVALILYLGLFSERYFGSRKKREIRIDEEHVMRTVATVVLATVALYVATYGVLRLGEWTYIRFVSNDWSIGGWSWLTRYQHILFFLVFVTLPPIAVLSAMPLPKQWDRTLDGCVRAGVVLYGAVLCTGIAAALAGSILGFLGDYALWNSS